MQVIVCKYKCKYSLAQIYFYDYLNILLSNHYFPFPSHKKELPNHNKETLILVREFPKTIRELPDHNLETQILVREFPKNNLELTFNILETPKKIREINILINEANIKIK